MNTLLWRIRARIGRWFLGRALVWMPADLSDREAIVRGLREQAEYDRYAAYSKLVDADPMPFDRWREIAVALRGFIKLAAA